MKIIDLRDKLPRVKHSIKKETTIYLNGRYVGFRHGKLGVGFVKTTKDGVMCDKAGRVRWYHSIELSLIDAIRYVRKQNKIEMPVRGWKSIKVAHYNNSTVNQIIKALI